MKKRKVFEVCAMCGAVAEKYSGNEEFKCANCGSNVCVVLSRKLFSELIKKLNKKD